MSKATISSLVSINHTAHPDPKVAEALTQVLADTYVLAVKTHGYHWNVTGPLFPQLHTLFEKQYADLFEAADAIAERLRALGSVPPGSMSAFLKLSNIAEDNAMHSARQMITDLALSHKKLSDGLDEAIDITNTAKDSASNDLMIERKRHHDKALWMLRAQLEE